MDLIGQGVVEALRLLLGGDAQTWHAILVSLACTGCAVGLAAALAIPYGAWLGIHRVPGRDLQVLILRVSMSIPTVALGLIVFALLSRRGLLGSLDLLYTRRAIVAGEFLLAFPLLASLAHAATARLEVRVVETAYTLGAGHLRTLMAILGEVRTGLVAALLVTFGRCVTELGVALTVGGNLALRTRTLPSLAQLELSRGRFAAALAPSVLLLLLALGAALTGQVIERRRSS